MITCNASSLPAVQVVQEDDQGPELAAAGSVVTIGAYDGVHRGHQAVIGEVRRKAAERRLASVVVTFDRHPASVVRPEAAPKLLTDLDQRLELLAETGVDVTLVVRFDNERAEETAIEFVEHVLAKRLRSRVIVVGDDFHFGKGRQGNVTMLTEIGPRLGFEVDPLRLVGADGTLAPSGTPKVSSTAIRAALVSGALEEANEMLGRHHEVRGVVVQGDRRGRDLGFPTANVEVPEEVCLPADGVYAGFYIRPGEAGRGLPSAISVGRRPTFYEDQPYSLLEAHILDMPGPGEPGALELYGESAKVRFVARLRGDERFDSVEELVSRMDQDCDEVREITRGVE